MHRGPDWLVLHDISAQGRVLLSRNSIRVNVACQLPGKTSEHDLGWLVGSWANALSADGQTLIFSDPMTGRTHAGNLTLFRRSTDGSPAVTLGEARGGGAISPDGRWVLAEQKANLSLLPVGAGSTVTLPSGNVVSVGGGAWLGDSRRIVFTGGTGDGKTRGYLQEIPAGIPRAITPDGVVLADKAAVRDDKSILGRVGTTWMLFPIHGGEGQRVPALTSGDIPLQWSDDGRHLYTVERASEGAPTSRRCISRGACDWRPGFVENALTGRPRGRASVERYRGYHPGRSVVLLLLHATAWRPVRGRRIEVSLKVTLPPSDGSLLPCLCR